MQARRPETREAFCRPGDGRVVELGHGGHAVRQDHPGLLRRRVDVNVGRKARGFLERADADEVDARAGLGIVAPHRDTAIDAAPEHLPLAARARERRLDRLALQQFDLRRLDDGVDGERRAGLALAPCAVAAMHDERLGVEAIMHGAAGAAAVSHFAPIGHCKAPYARRELQAWPASLPAFALSKQLPRLRATLDTSPHPRDTCRDNT